MMRKAAALAVVVSAATLLSACGGGGGSLLNRDRPDEMAVTRAAPLVVPPDFSLTPPNPGAPRPQDSETGRQALDALFGGPSARSGVETDTLNRAGTAAASIRSTVGDPGTQTVAKGQMVRDILAAPEGDGQAASASIPG
ncbi:hypothetical protein GGQ88_001338 [Novosphingobium hassiacum]|uniref:DUF3035 domain-containing protein n=2 Tax=Novosphingobium hassiacum TaxID=173676 RepID=A0A7W5ZXP5_9SPHN|nr:hypothetical protein [Novosphingobium hassiacum]